MAMNPNEIELAYVALWEKTVIPSAMDQLWSGYAEHKKKEVGRGRIYGATSRPRTLLLVN